MDVSTLTWNPASASMSQFTRTLCELKHPAPWKASSEDYGVILDANGDTVSIVDTNRERSDEDAFLLAIWIVTAVNTCAGYTAAFTKTEH